MKRTSIQVPEDLYEKVVELADLEFEGNRSFMIVKAIRYYLERGEHKLVEKFDTLMKEFKDLQQYVLSLEHRIPEQISIKNANQMRRIVRDQVIEDWIKDKETTIKIDKLSLLKEHYRFDHMQSGIQPAIDKLVEDGKLIVSPDNSLIWKL